MNVEDNNGISKKCMVYCIFLILLFAEKATFSESRSLNDSKIIR